jgi:hypothetical protein
MLKIFNSRFLLLCVAVSSLVACKKSASTGPVITGVRNYAPAPNDTVLTSLTPAGQWVVLEGRNLKDAEQVLIDGIPVTFNYGLFSDTSAVVQVPTVIPFNTVPTADQNTIKYITTSGSTTFTFNISVPPPVVTTISNEMAVPGDSVRITGANFFLINDLSFAGVSISAYNVSSDGTTLGFVAPQTTGGAPLVITTKSGTYTSPFNVEDSITGVLCNFDNVMTYQYWSAGLSNSSATFPGNRGNYAIFNTNGPLSNGDGSWWNGGRSINCNSAQWVPVARLGDTVGNWGFKFEINVPSAWNGISIFFVKDGNWGYLARYEPWKGTSGAATAYTTTGWQTVTIPLNMFLTTPNGAKDGTGVSASSLTVLLGSSGSGGVNAYVMNDGTAALSPTGLYAGIDNIRVVRIK